MFVRVCKCKCEHFKCIKRKMQRPPLQFHKTSVQMSAFHASNVHALAKHVFLTRLPFYAQFFKEKNRIFATVNATDEAATLVT